MSAPVWFLLAAPALLIAAGVWIYNRLVADRNPAREGFADIDVQLKRRGDLVPQLVEAVRDGGAEYRTTLALAPNRRLTLVRLGLDLRR